MRNLVTCIRHILYGIESGVAMLFCIPSARHGIWAPPFRAQWAQPCQSQRVFILW